MTREEANRIADAILEAEREHCAKESLLRAVASVTAYDVGSLCQNPAHKPLRYPRCPSCQLAARIEELRAEAKRIREGGHA
jgi:hypothetical protein